MVHVQYYSSFRCITVIRHVCNLEGDHPDKSRTHLTPHIVTTILLTVLFMI